MDNIYQIQTLSLIYGDSGPRYQLTNFIDDAVRHVFPSPVDNSIIFFADLRYS
jgi:hypothetical protein